MNSSSGTPTSTLTPGAELGTPEGSKGGLRGNMGVLALVLIAVAFNGPMAVVTGFVPLMVPFGNGIGAPLIFVALGLILLLFAVGLNALARYMKQPGAFYTYISTGLGKVAGLASGSIAMLAYVTFGAGTYALFAISIQQVLVGTFNVEGGPAWWVWAVVGWVIGTILSMLNINLSAKVLGIAALGEVVLVMAWNASIFVQGGPEGSSFAVFDEFFSGSLTWALVFGTVAMVGFESLQVFRSETKDPEKTVPRATYLFIGLVTALYAVSTYAYLIAYGPGEAARLGSTDPQGAVMESMSKYLGAVFGDLAMVLLVTSSFAACLAIQNVASRYAFQFGRDGVLPKRFGVANVKHGSPLFAAAVVGIVMLVLFIVPAIAEVDALTTWVNLVGVGSLAIIILWVATSIAVLVYFRRTKHTESIWAVLIVPMVSSLLLGTVLVLAIVNFVDVMGGDQAAATVGLVVVAALTATGVSAGFWFRKYRPDVYANIGSLNTETKISDS